MGTEPIERVFAVGTRLATLAAVAASSAGALLMIYIGLEETVKAFYVQLAPEDGPLPVSDAAAIHLISALDRFLMAIVHLYFAYGIYVLFVRPQQEDTTLLGIPCWLRVKSIGQLKQTLAEVIIVVLFVFFLRLTVETFLAHGASASWQEVLKLLSLPVSILLLAAALRLAQLHPKDPQNPED